VGDRDWQRAFTFDQPGKHPVKVRLEIEPHTDHTQTEPRVMLRREVPAMVEVQVGGTKPQKPGTAAWALASKTVARTITPGTGNLGGVDYTSDFTSGEGYASCTRTGREARKAEPKLVTATYARQAKWTVPPQRLRPEEGFAVTMSLGSAGSKCDPPGYMDTTKDGVLEWRAILIGSEAEGQPNDFKSLEVWRVRVGQAGVTSHFAPPKLDERHPRLKIEVSFTPGFGVVVGKTVTSQHTVVYEYRYEPGDGKGTP
jgi:hypothetical protein